MSHYKIEAGTAQHIGDRAEQQDRVALLTAPKAPGYMMAVVADGMGSLNVGAMAAEQVLRTAKQAFDLYSPQTEDLVTLLRTIARDAHTLIKLNSISSEKKPHSTMAILVLTPERSAVWAHVGDSRLYRFDGPNCAERTVDHSQVENLVQQGKLTYGQAREQKMPHVLYSALGSPESEPEITVGKHANLKAGDAFLLCTDGLWRYFSRVELGAAIAMNSPRQASEMLIAKVRERAQGHEADNCTMAIIKLVEPASETKSYTVDRMRRAV